MRKDLKNDSPFLNFDRWEALVASGKYYGIQTGNTSLLYLIEDSQIYRWNPTHNPDKQDLELANKNTLRDGRRTFSIIPVKNEPPQNRKDIPEFQPKVFNIEKEKI